MNGNEPTQMQQFIHNVRNPLNSISLHAELGKMLIDNKASEDEIKHAFNAIVEQCKVCEALLAEQRNKYG